MNIISNIFNNNTGDKVNLYKDYLLNLEEFKTEFTDCSDFLIKEVEVNGKNAFFCAMDGLVDSLQLNESVIEPILKCQLSLSGGEYPERINKCVAGAIETGEAKTFEDSFFYLMSGFCVFYIEGADKALVFGVQGWNRRNTDEPTNEAMVRGAKECFVETLNDNKALIRKRLKTPDLKLKQIKIGKTAPSPVVIAYVKGRAKSETVSEIEKRLLEAPLETVMDIGSVEAFIQGEPASIFSSVGNTERPDVFVSKLLEGRVGIMLEGTPFVLFTPCLFSDSFSSLDDYNNPSFYASFVRLLKYFSFFISLFLPALYVAIGSFHQEMIPTTLLYIIASSEDTTPFPLALEAVLIHILYEIMREAGLRLPKTVGHAVSIIGAIVIGEAMLVVVALTAISSYVVYPLYERVAVLRLIFIVIAGFTGLYGLTLAMCVLGVNICALNSFGVPFSAPFSPLIKESLGDTLLREGWKKLTSRRVRIDEMEGKND